MAKILSEDAARILMFLQANSAASLNVNQIADALEIRIHTANGVLSGLRRRGLIQQIEKESCKQKVVQLTAAGKSFDPQAEKE